MKRIRIEDRLRYNRLKAGCKVEYATEKMSIYERQELIYKKLRFLVCKYYHDRIDNEMLKMYRKNPK